jgi:hypothetical protein
MDIRKKFCLAEQLYLLPGTNLPLPYSDKGYVDTKDYSLVRDLHNLCSCNLLALNSEFV